MLVLTRNAASTLDRALKPLAPFGEILVHDANSEDETMAIAKKYGAKVLKQYDTEEKSVRVKDFTEIRLKQRADATFDWVFYLDADEEIPPELATEIGEILKTAYPKVIIKIPRLPVINGKIFRHGAFWPEVMPRIHHRKGGCTLQEGKAVHEKYVYDDSFTVVITRNPLFVPMDPLPDLIQKDDTYIALEAKRFREQGKRSLWHFIKWFLIREPLIMLNILLHILWCRVRYFGKDSLPFPYEWRIVRYHARLLGALIWSKVTS